MKLQKQIQIIEILSYTVYFTVNSIWYLYLYIKIWYWLSDRLIHISSSQLMNTSRQVGLRINWVIIDSKICISCTWEIQILHNIEMHILHMRNAYLAYRRGQDMLWKPGLRQVGWARCPGGGISINYFRGNFSLGGNILILLLSFIMNYDKCVLTFGFSIFTKNNNRKW